LPRIPKDEAYKFMNETPKLMDAVFLHISGGGSLTDFADLWNIDFAYVWQWVESNPERAATHKSATKARSDWATEKCLAHLRASATFDIRKLYDEKGVLLAPHKWPEEVAAAVAGLDVSEQYDKDGKITAHVKKTKMNDKLAAIKMQLTVEGKFIEKKELTGKFTIADLVGASFEGEADGSTQTKT
jgi:hypothetical protein